MSLPTLSRTYRRTKDSKSIELVDEPLPNSLQSTEVLIKVHAVSLNYRDVAMLHDTYPGGRIPRGIPCSDAAASVVAVGSAVSNFKPGDRVSPSFFLAFVTGAEHMDTMTALGGDVEGVLSEYAVFDQKVLTKIPQHLSWEEASTICCAGSTAWSALDMPFHKAMNTMEKVQTALLQGTGGVSLFALLICLAAGITPIITSSSDEKLAQVQALGSKEGDVLGINYRTHPNWDEEALALTNGLGVDVVINNVGIKAMEQSYNALRKTGTISLVGFLGGFDADKVPDLVTPLLMKQAKVQ